MTLTLFPKEIKILKNYLTEDELIDVRTKIFDLKDIWTYSPLSNKTRQFPLNYLPLSSHTYSRDVYREEIKTKRNIMFEKFGIYYDRIQKTLSELFNVPALYHDEYHYPGFHIHGPGEDDKILEHGLNRLHIHNDTSAGAIPHPHVNGGRIYSFLIPITLPKTGGGLLYHIDTDKFDMDYQEGNAYIWYGGRILHGIRPFQLTHSNDYRITLQTFINVKSSFCGLFW